MSQFYCRLLALYLNIRYFGDYLDGYVYMGHDLHDTDEVCGDMFIVECARCGWRAHTEVKLEKVIADELGSEDDD
ncbi:hypothetical protein [Williamsia sterculiae]|uniref:Uncharacterized protein n=1 Tax=Williamsia sterculiae TaxID=1344003 RepID=A0A1N7GHX2_9NOCA|nr:hypothetical protein [Williamsia sterculiae]SIS12108.1 hypothetical protein SAMN05445060_2804 [Williamsia sterculiae]